MPLHHRRILFSYHDADDGACDPWKGCASPPSPPPYTPPTPSPSPSFYWYPLAPPPIADLAPAPSPARHPAVGRRDQGGTTAYSPPPVAATDAHHRRFVTNVLAASAALVFLSLILLGVSVAVRHRNLRRRRRREALLAPAAAATTNAGNDDPDGGGGGGGVVHHVWHIKTVGLDEAAIESIAATRYRAGAGLLGAADCSVCLGEFSDGELLRLLPKCGHAFHVPCIDTWLRAHVNCPLCRSDVIDPAAETGVDSNSSAPADPDANANAAAEQVAAASDSTLERQDNEETDDQEGPPPRVEEEDQQEQELSSPEPLPQLPCPLTRNVRRAASMDAATVSAAADVAALDRLPEAAPEGEQSDRVKDRTATDGHTTSTERLAYGAPPRFFFSRHCRARSSVLPL